MKQFVIILILTLCLNLIWLLETDAFCGECQKKNSVACHNLYTFSLCHNGIISEEYVDCRPGTVCSDHVKICQPIEMVEPSCKKESFVPPNSTCGRCEPTNNVFSCVATNLIAFCFGEPEPLLSSVATCPEGTFCDINNYQTYCSPQEDAWPSCQKTEEEFNEENKSNQEISSESEPVTTEQTFPTTAETEPTEEVPTEYEEVVTKATQFEELTTTAEQNYSKPTVPPKPNDKFRDFCGKKAYEQSYSNIYDASCETYIYCVFQNKSWMGVEMYCDDEYPYYDPQTDLCTPVKPVLCP